MRFHTSDPRVVGFIAESLADSADEGMPVTIEITDAGRIVIDGFDVQQEIDDADDD